MTELDKIIGKPRLLSEKADLSFEETMYLAANKKHFLELRRINRMWSTAVYGRPADFTKTAEYGVYSAKLVTALRQDNVKGRLLAKLITIWDPVDYNWSSQRKTRRAIVDYYSSSKAKNDD